MNIIINFEHDKVMVENIIKRKVSSDNYIVWYKNSDDTIGQFTFDTKSIKFVEVLLDK